MSLVNYKVDLELTWTKHSLICDNDDAAGTQVSFKITDTKLYMPIVTLSTKDNSNLNKQLSEGFKRTVHWNRYKLIPITVDAKTVNNVKVNTEFRKLLDASFAGVNEYILPTQKITNYNVIIDDRNFYDQPINNEIKQYGKIRKIATGKGDNYATGGFLDSLLSKIAGPLMKVAMPLAKNVVAPLGLTAAMSAKDGGIQRKMRGEGIKLMIDNEDMNDIMKIIKALEKSGTLLSGVSRTIENEVKEQKGGFLSMLLGRLGAGLLGNLLTGTKGIMRAGKGIMRALEGIKKKTKIAITISSVN